MILLPRVKAFVLVLAFLSLDSQPASAAYEYLRRYDVGDTLFEEVSVNDAIVVYFHQRMIGQATVEGDYVVYQFEKAGGKLLARKSHWRGDLPEQYLPPVVPREEAESIAGGESRSTTLYILSPTSVVYPVTPTPSDPCWVVRTKQNGSLQIIIVDAMTGEILGRGVPPPDMGFCLTGPIYWWPCSQSWASWSESAAQGLAAMGYGTEQIIWPNQATIQQYVQDPSAPLFYELAHGDSNVFDSGCTGGQGPAPTTAGMIEEWMATAEKKQFAFIGSCDGLCSTDDNTFSYEFRKGSMENTTTIGYCHMSETQCELCWGYSLYWQNALFNYMRQSLPVSQAYAWANADYPACAANSCMRFCGDSAFVLPIQDHITLLVYPDGHGSYPTIQAAVDAAYEGDVVELMTGTFSGDGNRDIDFRGKAITVRSHSRIPESCIIDCQGTPGVAHRGFYFRHNEAGTSILEGIKIVNGDVTAVGQDGGGIACDHSAPTIRNCVLEGNTARSGGGMFLLGSQAVLMDSVVLQGNSTSSSGDGGGLLCLSPATLTGCRFLGNEARSSGGGMSWNHTGSLVLQDCTFSENSCSTGVGGGLSCVGEGASAVRLEACRFAHNVAAEDAALTANGAALDIAHCLFAQHAGSPHVVTIANSDSSTVRNCTFADNAIVGNSAVLHSVGSALGVANTIIAFSDGGPPAQCAQGGTTTLSCCDLYGNTGGNWVGCLTGQEGVRGNFSADPSFCDAVGGNYSLYNISPCLSAEQPECGLIGALDRGCYLELLVVRPDGSGDYPTIQAAISAASDSALIELTDGVFTGPGSRDIDFLGKRLVVRSQSGNPPACIIDCQGSNQDRHRGFFLHLSETANSRIEGLTIRGGYARQGAAVCCQGSSPTITRCLLVGNHAINMGGGVCCLGLAQPTIVNCTFYGNYASSGGGISCDALSVATMRNTIVAASPSGEAIHCQGTDPPILSCCDLYGNADGDWIDCVAPLLGTDGNIGEDPLFCASGSGDLTIAENSPCAPGQSQPACALIGAMDVGCQSTGVTERSPGTTDLLLGNGMPNPFASLTILSYLVPRRRTESPVSLSIFDPAGRMVRSLVESPLASGAYRVAWDGRDGQGRQLPSGLYYVRLSHDGEVRSKQIVLLK